MQVVANICALVVCIDPYRIAGAGVGRLNRNHMYPQCCTYVRDDLETISLRGHGGVPCCRSIVGFVLVIDGVCGVVLHTVFMEAEVYFPTLSALSCQLD